MTTITSSTQFGRCCTKGVCVAHNATRKPAFGMAMQKTVHRSAKKAAEEAARHGADLSTTIFTKGGGGFFSKLASIPPFSWFSKVWQIDNRGLKHFEKANELIASGVPEHKLPKALDKTFVKTA